MTTNLVDSIPSVRVTFAAACRLAAAFCNMHRTTITGVVLILSCLPADTIAREPASQASDDKLMSHPRHQQQIRPLSSLSLDQALDPVSLKGVSLNPPPQRSPTKTVHHVTQRPLQIARSEPSVRHRRMLLSFNDPSLEERGLHFGPATDFVSSLRFFGRVPIAPAMMVAVKTRHGVQNPVPHSDPFLYTTAAADSGNRRHSGSRHRCSFPDHSLAGSIHRDCIVPATYAAIR